MIDRYHGELLSTHSPSGNRGNHPITGFNAVVDEAALAALALTCTSADRNRVVEQTAAEGLYRWNGAAFVRLDPAAALAAAAAAQSTANTAQSGVTALQAAQPYGFDKGLRLLGPAPVQINSGSSADIAGPDAGFIRVLALVHVFPTTNANAVTTYQIYTGATPGLMIRRSVAIGYGTGISQYNTCGIPGCLVLAPGESLKVSNAGPAVGMLTYRYYDLPDIGYTFMRVAVTSPSVPHVLVPAPASGFINRVPKFAVNLMGALGPVFAPQPAYIAYNDDTGTLPLDAFLGGVLTARTTANSAGFFYPDLPLVNDVDVLTAADVIGLCLRADPGTIATPGRSANVALCYQTLPIPA